MKKIFLTIALFLGVYMFAFSQDSDFFTALDDVLTNDEKTIISDAQKKIEKGDTYVNKAEEEDVANAKLLSSTKERKKKKAEKKLLEAKKYRIQAAEFYDTGYQSVFDLYMEKINAAEWEFTEDGTQAQKYIDDGNTAFADAQRTLKTYSDATEDNLEDNIKYTTLKSDLKSVKTDEEDALQMLVDAIALWTSQAEKKGELDAADQLSWKNALALNTIPAYKNYLASYPTGLHAQEAADKIEALEEAFLAAQQANTSVTYKVQICADKKKWTTANLKSKIYAGTETVAERYADGYYKYSIGEFKTYKEAKTLKTKSGVKGAFVVCFVAGVQVEITKALEVEGVKP
jgi:hypothetical protein